MGRGSEERSEPSISHDGSRMAGYELSEEDKSTLTRNGRASTNMMMADQKRRSDGLLFLGCEGGGGRRNSGGGASSCGAASKRLKIASDSSNGGCERGSISISREKKDKIGERVAALQQLVSPFGKTDTASVLHEATGYIKFLHEQLKVLSAPYLLIPPVGNSQESGHSSLRSRGLCLVPVSYTDKLRSSNGADIWAPINTSGPKF